MVDGLEEGGLAEPGKATAAGQQSRRDDDEGRERARHADGEDERADEQRPLGGARRATEPTMPVPLSARIRARRPCGCRCRRRRRPARGRGSAVSAHGPAGDHDRRGDHKPGCAGGTCTRGRATPPLPAAAVSSPQAGSAGGGQQEHGGQHAERPVRGRRHELHQQAGSTAPMESPRPGEALLMKAPSGRSRCCRIEQRRSERAGQGPGREALHDAGGQQPATPRALRNSDMEPPRARRRRSAPDVVRRGRRGRRRRAARRAGRRRRCRTPSSARRS